MRPFIRSNQKGAETPLWLATAPEAGAVSGKYFYDKQATQPSSAARDDAAAHRLWQISLEMTNLAESVPA